MLGEIKQDIKAMEKAIPPWDWDEGYDDIYSSLIRELQRAKESENCV